MSAEKINNQNHINTTNQEAMGTIESLKKEFNQGQRITGTTATTSIENNTIQQLLSQQSCLANLILLPK